MSNYNSANLWDVKMMNRAIFNWRDILNTWNENLCMHPNVQIVIDNLRAASSWESGHDITIHHFLQYLNYEPEAIAWLLYEIVAMRWMWGESRIDWVKYLVSRSDILNLESGFPAFPGSPNQRQSVREFLESHLTTDELEYIEMPSTPPVTTTQRIGNMSISTITDAAGNTRRIIQTNVIADPEPPIASSVTSIDSHSKKDKKNKKSKHKKDKKSKKDKKQNDQNDNDEETGILQHLHTLLEFINEEEERYEQEENDLNTAFLEQEEEQMSQVQYSPMVFHFINDKNNSKLDEIIYIYKNDEDSYRIVFKDGDTGKKNKVENVSSSYVLRYIRGILRMLRSDKDPYDAIQFIPPNGPMVYLDTNLDLDVREDIYDMMENAMDAWPVSC